MKLFEIEQAIEDCLDTETGEFDEERFNALTQERNQKLENLICYYKNVCADAEALKVQEKIFTERRKREEKHAESLKQYIARILDGEKFKTDKVMVGFRKSKSVLVSEDFVAWAQKNDRDDLLKYKEPEADKTAIKAAIEAGEDVPAEIIEINNISIK